MKTLTFGQLLARLTEIARERDGDDSTLDLPVFVRVQDDNAGTSVGGLFAVDVDPGCTERDALMLDAATEAEDPS